jgi:streptogramin lyase
VRRQAGRITFTSLDAFSLDVVWASDVTQGAIPLSFYPADDGTVFYIDRATGAVVRLSQRGGSSTSWQLPPGQGDSARILSIDL